MPMSAIKLGIQCARFAAASQNVGTAGFRGTFNRHDENNVRRHNFATAAIAKYPHAVHRDAPPSSSPELGNFRSTETEFVTHNLTTLKPDISRLLTGFTAPPKSVGLAQWPAVKNVDARLCMDLPLSAQRVKFGDVARAIRQVMDSINNFGAYPSMVGLARLIVVTGRDRDLKNLDVLHSIGAHTVAASASDPKWQLPAASTLGSAMVAGLAHAGAAERALAHKDRMVNAGLVPDADAYGALIASFKYHADETALAEQTFSEAQQLSVVPNVYLYSVIIGKLCRSRKVERAMQLFEEMRQKDISPSTVVYGALINGCTRTGEEQNARLMFTMMESDPNFRPNAPPFNALMQFYTYTRQDRAEALRFHRRMQHYNVAPTAFTYKLLLDVFGHIEPVDVLGVEQVFGNLIADDRVDVDGTHWATVLIAHGVHMGDLNKAIEVFDSISTHIATRMAAQRHRTQAMHMPDALAYEAILRVFLFHGRLDLMRAYFQRMMIEGVPRTAYLANLLIQGVSAQNDTLLPPTPPADEQTPNLTGESGMVPYGLAQARALFEAMADPAIGKAAVGNHPPKANEVFVEPAGLAAEAQDEDGSADLQYVRGVMREPSTFMTMIEVEVKFGNLAEARQLAERMQQRGYPPHVVVKAYNMLEAADAQAVETEEEGGGDVKGEEKVVEGRPRAVSL